MSVNLGWIKLHRKIFDNPKLWSDSDYMSIWILMLLLATHAERPALFKGYNIKLKPGQFITGRNFLSEKTKIHESKVQRILKYFEKSQQISQDTSNSNRLITIINWDFYQCTE